MSGPLGNQVGKENWKRVATNLKFLDEVCPSINENTLQFGNWLIWGIKQYGQQFTNISADTSVKTPYKRHDSHNFQHNNFYMAVIKGGGSGIL